ncbi:MAG TPA: SurA N-terminal domain-containing protein [Candidatus Angelobacter sp.]|nr:SurA N-terminal domain-containing protein [Candidatus Angelobacter sp.]
MVQAFKLRVCTAVVMAAFLPLASSCNRQNSDKDTLARVNSYKITRAEVDRAYDRQIVGAPVKPTAEEEAALRLQVLQQIVSQQIYMQKAEKLGIIATDDEVEARLNQDKAPFTKEEFAKRLKDAGYTEDERRQEIRKQLTIDKLFNKEIAARVTISDSDIQTYYNQNKSQFNIIEPLYYMAHIFVSAQPNVPSSQIPGKAQNEAQAKEKIRTIYNRLESGEDFSTLATKYSEDIDTARNGGELQPAPESRIKESDTATREAVLKLKPGQYSSVIPIVNPSTQKVLAYRIVKLIGREPAGQRDLSDPGVQQHIRNQLRNQREQFLKNAYDDVLRNSAEVHDYYAEQLLKNVGQK